MKIGLLGQFGSGNSGNDGSLEAMVRFLRRVKPDAELVCICSNPERVERNLNVAAISITGGDIEQPLLRSLNRGLLGLPRRLHNFLLAIACTRKFNAIIIPGTGILDDFQEHPFGWPYVLFRWCVAAALNGTRIAFVSIGAGPIRHPLSRWFLTSAARRGTYRSYRDVGSWAFMKSIGFDLSRDRIFPDVAFSLPAPAPRPRATSGTSTIGVGVMAYRGWSKDSGDQDAIYAAYLAKIGQFIVWLVEHGHKVRILTGDAQDWQAVEDLTKRLAATHPAVLPDVVAEQATDLHALMAQIEHTDMVVATRFHNVVCALKLGRPTVSLGYSAKNDDLLADMGLADFCQHVETFDLDRLIAQFETLHAERELHSDRIREHLVAYGQRLALQEALLLETVLREEPVMAGARQPEVKPS